MIKTLTHVFPQVRNWPQDKFPGSCSVMVEFENEEAGEYYTKTEKAQEHITKLTELIGKPSEFELEPKPEFKGKKQFRIRSYEGKTQSSFGGGGRQWQPAWSQSKEGVEYHEERTDRRTSLMQGVIAAGPGATPEAVWFHMKAYYKLLRNNLGPVVQNDPKPPEASQKAAQGHRNGDSEDPFE